MALQVTGGFLYPVRGSILSVGQNNGAELGISTLSNGTDFIHQIGNVRWSPGGGLPKSVTRIRFVTGTVTPGGSNVLTVGVQPISTAVFNPLRGTGSYTNSGTIAGATLNSNTGNFVTLSTNPSIDAGQLVCVSMHFSTFVDGSLQIRRLIAPATNQMPVVTAANVAVAGVPNILFEATDGTYGIIENADFAINVTDGPNWDNASTNPERGNVFRVPVPCTANAIWVAGFRMNATTGTLVARLYQNALTTPSVLSTVNVTSDMWANATASQRFVTFPIPPSTTLTPGVDYAVTLEATSTVNVFAPCLDHQSAAFSVALVGGSTAFRIERARVTDSTPAFTQVPTQCFQMGVRIHQIEDGGVAAGSVAARSLLNVGLN